MTVQGSIPEIRRCRIRLGQDAQIDGAQQAQILTSYVAAGILTRNEARAQLGQAPVEDDAADALLVTTGTGPAPLPQLAAGEGALGKYNHFHDEVGRFTTASGAAIVSPAPNMRNHDLKTKDVQVAQAQLAPAVRVKSRPTRRNSGPIWRRRLRKASRRCTIC